MATNGIGTFRPFRVVVPNRVDIAGGTLDIYPLYLLIGDAMTVNVAVGVRSGVGVRRVVRLAGRPDAGGRKADRDGVQQGRDRTGGDGDRGGPPEEPDRSAG